MTEAEVRRFFIRAFLATGLMAAVVTLWLSASGHVRWALGLLAGVVVGTAAMYVLVELSLVLTATDRSARSRKKIFMALQAAKYLALAAVLYLLVNVWHIEPISFVVGISLSLAAMLFRPLGKSFSRTAPRDDRVGSGGDV